MKLGALTLDQQESFLLSIDDINVDNIFGANICYGPGRYIKDGEGNRSIGTISSPNINQIYYNNDYRISFTDKGGNSYSLKVTDLYFRKYLDYLNYQVGILPSEISLFLKEKLNMARLFFRIGLARGDWVKYPGRCYLQINGVYSYPDYLNGLTLADLKQQ